MRKTRLWIQICRKTTIRQRTHIRGKYGQEKDLDEVTKDQIDKILHEKAEHIHQLFENGGVE